MKRTISKKLTLKKVTISIHRIRGAADAPIDDPQTSDETLSSAFHDPTEIHSISSLYLSQDAEVCA